MDAVEARTTVERRDEGRWVEEFRARLQDYQGLLGRHVSGARQILRELLVGRLTFTSHEGTDGPCYEFSGEPSLGRILSGLVSTRVW